MTNKDPYDRFSGRYQTLTRLIADAADDKDVKAQPFLISLLSELLRFGEGYSIYFLGLPNISQSELNIALTRLQEEWARISRACDQRRFATFRTVLQQMDDQALSYYKRFWGYKANKDIGPITYIEKYFEITRYAFAPYPLISVPFLYMDETNNINQSLAHEMGHFIYWNSAPISQYHDFQKGLKEEVTQKLSAAAPTNSFKDFDHWQKLSKSWGAWFEETFADVSGTLFGGAGFFESSRDIAGEMSLTELIKDDGEHPIPFLRPLIALEALGWMSEQATHRAFVPSPEEINDLKRLWLNDLANEGIDTNHLVIDLPFDLIEKSISIVVRTILQEPRWSGKTQGSDNKQVSTNLGSLILPEPDPDTGIRIPSVSVPPFQRLQEQLRKRVIDESLKNKIVLDAQDPQVELLLRAAIIGLDLGDEDGRYRPKPPPR